MRFSDSETWMMHSGVMNWGMMIFMMIFWTIVLGLVIYGIIMLVTRGNERNKSDNPNRSENRALDILNERFAKGDLSEDEYKSKRDLLMDKDK